MKRKEKYRTTLSRGGIRRILRNQVQSDPPHAKSGFAKGVLVGFFSSFLSGLCIYYIVQLHQDYGLSRKIGADLIKIKDQINRNCKGIGNRKKTSSDSKYFHFNRISIIPSINENSVKKLIAILSKADVNDRLREDASRIIKSDLLAHIYNRNFVSQRNAEEYYDYLDRICIWSGVHLNLLCSYSQLVFKHPRTGHYASFHRFGASYNENDKKYDCHDPALYDRATYSD